MLVAVLVTLAVVGLGALVLLYRLGRASHDAHIDALTAMGEAHGVAPSNGRCFAEATVDAMGLDALQDVATADEIRDHPDRTLRSWGISLDEGQAEGFYDQLQECIDTRQLYMDRVLDEVTPEVRACVGEALSDELLRRFFVILWVDLENPLEVDPDLRSDFIAAVGHCPLALDG